MKDREIRKMLKHAYEVTPTYSEIAFLKAHEKRKSRFFDVAMLEFKYMGIRSILSGTLIIKDYLEISILSTICFVGLPYMFTVWSR